MFQSISRHNGWAKHSSLQLTANCIVAIRCLRYFVELIWESPTTPTTRLSFKIRIEWPSVLTATASLSSVFFQLQQNSRYHPNFSAHKTALMTKTTLIFPAFSLRFVDFAVQFCFCCKFSFHGKPFKSSSRWHDFPGPITIILLCIATNEIASFLYRQQITSNGFFHVCRSGQRSAFEFWNKKVVCFFIVQNK